MSRDRRTSTAGQPTARTGRGRGGAHRRGRRQSFDGCADPRLKAGDAVAGPAPARVHPRRAADRSRSGTPRSSSSPRPGHITDDKRQEFILLSDVLGASMQTIAVNNPAYKDATEATVFGPFFVEDAPEIPLGGDIAGGAAGRAVLGRGTRRATPTGTPCPGPGSRSGRRTRTASTTSSTPTAGSPAAAHLFADEDGGTRSGG